MKGVAASGEIGDRHFHQVAELPADGGGFGELGRGWVGGFLTEEINLGGV